MKSKLITLTLALAAATASQATVYVTMSNGDWGTVNVATATFNYLGTHHSATGAVLTMGDVAIDPTTGQAYGVGADASFVQIDKANGDVSNPLGSTYTNNMGALADGTIIEASGRELVKVDKSDGSFSSFGLYRDETIFDLATSLGHKIYGTDAENMYVRDESDLGSTATLLGNTGFTLVFGLAFENNVLYGYGFDGATAVQFEVDQVTGVGSNAIALNGQATDQYVYGAAGQDAVPEPFTLGVLGSLALVALKRKRK